MDRPLSTTLLFFALAIGGCRSKGCRSANEGERGGTATSRSTATPSVAPDARLAVVGDAAERALRIEVHGPREARLAPEATVERRRDDGSFEAVGVYRLVTKCDETPPDCLTLTAGAELRPLPWRLVVGDDLQCDCEGCGRARPGIYRFVARTCDGTRLEGEAFEIAR